MKTMHRILTLGLGVLLLTSSSAALAHRWHHGGHDPAARIEHHLQRLSQSTTLTAEQTTKIRVVLQKEADTLQTLRSEQNLTKEARHAKRHELHQATRAAIESILTVEQRQAVAQAKAKHHQDRLNHRVERLREKLDLRPDQVVQVTKVLQDAHTQLKALKAAATPPNEATHAQFEALHQKTHASILALLDSAQQAKFTAMRQDHHRRGGRHHRHDNE